MNKRERLVSTVVGAATAVACGEEPPVYCGDAIPQQSVFVHQETTVEPCFQDPAGGTLTLSATSSDESKVRASRRGSKVSVHGVAIGEAKVTVTATNEAQLTAETSFSVRVPNRAPEFVSTLRDAWVIVDESIQWKLMEFFKDPDGEQMTFAATSSNSGAVAVTIAGTDAEVSGVSEGQSRITLTATDPHGSSGSGTIEVTARGQVTLIEDDFDTDASLDDWETPDDDDFMSAEIDDGYLVLASDTFWTAFLSQELGGEAEDWTVDVVLNNPDQNGRSGFYLWTGHQRYSEYRLLVGEAQYGGEIGLANWLFVWRDESQGIFVTDSWAYGLSRDIDDFSDLAISISSIGDSIWGTVDGKPLFKHGNENYLVNTAVEFGPAVAPEGFDGAEGSFNSVRVKALEFTESSSAAYVRTDPIEPKVSRLQKGGSSE